MTETRRNSNGEELPPRLPSDLDYDDKLAGRHNMPYPAQPDTLPADRARARLEQSIATLRDVRFYLRNTQPSKERRGELKRQLSGVLADVEIVRQAIRE